MIRPCMILLLMGAAICLPLSAQVYKNQDKPVEERVDDLLKRMSLEEKVAQLSMTGLNDFDKCPLSYGVCDSPFEGVEEIAAISARVKRHAREKTRLGIPPIQIAECLHGQLAYGATIFPQAIAQGSTWNPELIEKMASTIAAEASASGVDQALSPLFDLIKDARYGRNEECYAEDPYLVAEMGKAFVIGMQGSPKETQKTIPAGKLMCTAKHFAGYSIPWAGINLAPSSLGERELRTLYLYPFEQVIKEANVYSVMPSYNETDGVPAHASHFLLNQILRNEWDFKGYVFSDYGGISQLYNFHKTARGKEDAARQAFEAGVDLEAARPEMYPCLVDMVKRGEMAESLIDESVKRILTVKFKGGLFEKKYPDPAEVKKHIHLPEHIALAQQVAEESIILLKNENQLLPLDIARLKNVAVIGPNANQVQYGDYSYTRDNKSGDTVLDGIRRLVGDQVNVRYAKGCDISGLSKDGFPEAVEAARQSDAIVFVAGGTSVILSGLGWGKGPGADEVQDPFTCGEGYDLTDINPLGVQRELMQALYATGKPIVLVLVHGRPWSILWEKANLPAILEAWYPGEKGGIAIANILFGKVNPSGRLNVTIPQSVGHIPVSYNYKPSAKGINREPGMPDKAGRDYVFSSPAPLFPFGFGLSYTSFTYSDMRVSAQTVGEEPFEVSVNVKNTGSRTGKEVVQLYVNDVVSSVTTPVMELKRFRKIELKPGEVQRVCFTLSAKDLALWNARMKYVTEPGTFELMFAKSAEEVQCRETIQVAP